MGALGARRRFAAITGSKFRIEYDPLLPSSRLRRSLLLAELSLAELSAYFWLNCLNFKSAELSLAEWSGRGVRYFLCFWSGKHKVFINLVAFIMKCLMVRVLICCDTVLFSDKSQFQKTITLKSRKS